MRRGSPGQCPPSTIRSPARARASYAISTLLRRTRRQLPLRVPWRHPGLHLFGVRTFPTKLRGATGFGESRDGRSSSNVDSGRAGVSRSPLLGDRPMYCGDWSSKLADMATRTRSATATRSSRLGCTAPASLARSSGDGTASASGMRRSASSWTAVQPRAYVERCSRAAARRSCAQSRRRKTALSPWDASAGFARHRPLRPFGSRCAEDQPS
jgi:hypothetical protein